MNEIVNFEQCKNMNSLSYNIFHKGQEASLVFQTSYYGEVSISFRCVTAPNGGTGLVYDCFNATIGREMQQISEEKEFAEDLAKIIHLLENALLKKMQGATSDFLFDAFDAVINLHIQQYGRIVDTDLYSTISQMTIAVDLLGRKEPKGKPLDEQAKRRLLESFMARVEQKFGNYLYLTTYARTPSGLQPQLISFNDFKKNL